MKITPAHSILPNSIPHILQPIKAKSDTFQVVWIEQINEHGLFYAREDGVVDVLATHHNGHSCYALGARIAAGNVDEAMQQFDYILRCGGMGKSREYALCVAERNRSDVPAMLKLDALQEEVWKLSALLQDKQTGLTAWNLLLKARLETLVDMAALAGIRPTAARS